MSLEIRSIEKHDAPIIEQLGRQTFRESFGHLFPEDVLQRYLKATFDQQKLAASIVKPWNHYSVINYGGEDVGYMKIKSDSKHSAVDEPKQYQLQKLYVLKAYQNKRLGGDLLQYGVKFCAKSAPAGVWLAVLDENEAAARFYQRAGFVECGEYFHQFEHKEMRFIVMSLGLTQNNET